MQYNHWIMEGYWISFWQFGFIHTKEPDLAAIAKKEEENHIKAEERFREALKELKSQKLKDHERQSRWATSRTFAWFSIIRINSTLRLFLCLSIDPSMPERRHYRLKRKDQQRWPVSHCLPQTAYRWFLYCSEYEWHRFTVLHCSMSYLK